MSIGQDAEQNLPHFDGAGGIAIRVQGPRRGRPSVNFQAFGWNP